MITAQKTPIPCYIEYIAHKRRNLENDSQLTTFYVSVSET